nr:hypothetical protein [Tanacetum cinerariifolium]
MMEELRRSGRLRGQRPVVEENTIDEAINVHEEDSDDDFVHVTTPEKWTKRMIVARSPDIPTIVKESEIRKGKKRAANDKKINRPKKPKVFVEREAATAESEAGPSRVRKQNKKVKKSKNDSTTLRTRSSPKAMYLALATLNPNQQYCVAKIGFGSLLDFKVDDIPSRLGFYVMIYVDGVKCKSLQMVRKRPPTSVWTAEILKEREEEEITSGGIGLGEKEYEFMEEDENGVPKDLKGFAWKLEKYIETISKSKTCFDKTIAIRMEVFPDSALLKDLEVKYVKASRIDNVEERKIDGLELISFDSPQYTFGPLTQAAVIETADQGVETADRAVASKLKGKAVDINEILRQTIAVKDNLLDTWGEVLNFNKCLRDTLSPLRAFFPTFVVTNEFRKAKLSAEVRYNLFTDYMRKSIVKDKRWKEFKDVGLVFIPVSNDEHQFLEVFNLKTPYVCVLDSKKGEKVETKKYTKHDKKDSRIENDSLASILHADFGRYLASVGHTKGSDILTGGLKYLKMKCQTNSKDANCGVFVMRHMETYMGNTNKKFDCGLDVEGRKQTGQINKLRMKYAAKILLSECNIRIEKVRDQLNGK